MQFLSWGEKNYVRPFLKVIKSQIEYMKSSYCPKYERIIRDISALVDYIDYPDVSIKNINILPNRQYIANTADSA